MKRVDFRPYLPGDLRLIDDPAIDDRVRAIGDMDLSSLCRHAETMTRGGRPIGVGSITPREDGDAVAVLLDRSATPGEIRAALRRMARVLDALAIEEAVCSYAARTRTDFGRRLLTHLGFQQTGEETFDGETYELWRRAA